MISKFENDWNAFKALKNKVDCTIRKDKEVYYKNLIHKSNDQKDTCKSINSILGRNQSKPTTFNVKVEDKDIKMPDEVTECFNDYFSGVGFNANSVGEGNFKHDEFMKKKLQIHFISRFLINLQFSHVAFNFCLKIHRTRQNSSQNFRNCCPGYCLISNKFI